MMHPPGRHHDSSGYLFLFGGLSVVAIVFGLILVTAKLGPPAIPIWMVTIGGLWLASRGPIGQAIAARIHPNQLDRQDVESIIPPELYAELDELRGRVAELEERQEFSERLLSSRTDRPDVS